MLTVGLIAFGVGVLVGYISLRSLGWLLVLCVGIVSGSAGTGTIIATNSSGTDMGFRLEVWSGGAWTFNSQGAVYAHNVWTAPGSQGNYWKFMWRTYGTSDTVQTDYSSNPLGATEDFVTTWTGSPPVTSYYTSVCWTNKTGFPARVHIAYSDGQYADSGNLAPGGIFCTSRTNTTWFQWQICDVLFSPDGTSRVNCSSVNNPSTNSYPGSGGSGQGNYVGGGPMPNNPIGSGAGAGSGSGLTGGQFANGASNIVNVIYQSGNRASMDSAALRDLNQQLNATMFGVSNDIVNMSGFIQTGDSNTQYTVRTTSSNVVNEVRTGSSNIVDEVRTGSSNQVAATTTGSSNIVNQLQQGTPGQGTNTAPDYTGLLSAISNNTYQARPDVLSSNMTAQQTGHGFSYDDFKSNPTQATTNLVNGIKTAWEEVLNTNFAWVVSEGTNISTGELVTEDEFWTVPVYTNVAKSGYMQIKVRATQFWTQLCPWVRLVATFIIAMMTMQYIKFRVEETMAQYLGMAPGGGPGEKTAAGIVYGLTMGVTGYAILFAMMPIMIASAINVFDGFYGGKVANPLSDTGIASAGTYSYAIYAGLKLFGDLFPWPYAVAVFGWLALFDSSVVGFILGAQRFIRFLSK